jgi:hypothetical protein
VGKLTVIGIFGGLKEKYFHDLNLFSKVLERNRERSK